MVQKIKEVCYVGVERRDWWNSPVPEIPEMEYVLPQGTSIFIGNERIRCPEPLFSPHLIGLSMCGLHDVAYNSVMKCKERAPLYENIVLAGGNTLFRGFGDRIKICMEELTPSKTVINVIEPENRIHSAWIGGATLASSPDFEEKWITSQEYQEFGVSILKRKCVQQRNY